MICVCFMICALLSLLCDYEGFFQGSIVYSVVFGGVFVY